MTKVRHYELDQVEGIHTSYTWLWADAAARTAQTGVTQDQVDAACTGLQLDEDTVWRATDIVPTWQQIGSGGAAANQHTVNPASNDVIVQIVESIRNTSAAPQDGIGGSYDIVVEHSGGQDVAGRFAAAWQDESTQTSTVLLTGSQGAEDRVVFAALPNSSGITPPTPDEVVLLLGPGAVVIVPTLADTTEIPTGAGAAMVGGENNKGGGEYSFMAAGRYNEMESNDSLVSGHGSKSRFPGSRAHASGRNAAAGDAQSHDFTMLATTFNNTPFPLTHADGNISFADNTTFVIKLDVIARNITNPPQNAYYRCWVRGYCAAGAVTISASAKEIESEDTGVWDINFSASTNEVVIEVEGHVTDTTYWLAWVQVIEVIG